MHGSDDLPGHAFGEGQSSSRITPGPRPCTHRTTTSIPSPSGASRDDRSRDGILHAHRRNLAEFQTYPTLVERVAKALAKDPAIDEPTINKEFRGLLKGWLFDRIVVIDDYYASGTR